MNYLQIRNKLYHATLWLRRAEILHPNNPSVFGVYDAILQIDKTRREHFDVSPQHRMDCKRCREIREICLKMRGK